MILLRSVIIHTNTHTYKAIVSLSELYYTHVIFNKAIRKEFELIPPDKKKGGKKFKRSEINTKKYGFQGYVSISSLRRGTGSS